jgi:hypothetical protein
MRVYGVEDVAVFGQTFAGNSLRPILVLTIVIGEVISCGILGLLLYHSAKRIPQLK